MTKGEASTRNILQSGLKVAAGTVANLLGWMVAGKVLAIAVGPAGVGLYGLLRQLLQNLSVVATCNGQNALIQGIATRREPADQQRFAASVLVLQLAGAAAISLALLLLAPFAGAKLIPHVQGAALLRSLVVPLFAAVVQAWGIGVLSGHRRVNALLRSQLMGPLAVAVLVFPTVWWLRDGRPGAYALMLAGPAVMVGGVAVLEAYRAGLLPRGLSRVRRSDGARFFRMSTVLLASAAMTTGMQFVQSLAVARWLGLEAAGYYWTAWTLGMTYVTLVLGSFGTYYMPTLSGIADEDARRALMGRYLDICLVAMPLLVAAAIVFKPWAIRAVFSAELLPATRVMRWMLIGDLFKGVSWVLAMPMIALNHMRWFFWSEALFSLGLAGASIASLALGLGIEGLGAAFLAAYVLYLPAMVQYARVRHGFRWTDGQLRVLAAGIGLVGAVSAASWSRVSVEPGPVALLIVLGVGFLALARRSAAAPAVAST